MTEASKKQRDNTKILLHLTSSRGGCRLAQKRQNNHLYKALLEIIERVGSVALICPNEYCEEIERNEKAIRRYKSFINKIYALPLRCKSSYGVASSKLQSERRKRLEIRAMIWRDRNLELAERLPRDVCRRPRTQFIRNALADGWKFACVRDSNSPGGASLRVRELWMAA